MKRVNRFQPPPAPSSAICIVALLLSGCGVPSKWAPTERQHGATCRAQLPDNQYVLLHYAVVGFSGERWKHEMILAQDRYVERRSRLDGEYYILGKNPEGEWIQVGDRPPHQAHGWWAEDIQSRRAFFGAAFLCDESQANFSTDGGFREFFFRSEQPDRPSLRVSSGFSPTRSEWMDADGRRLSCDAVEWEGIGGAWFPQQLECSVRLGWGYGMVQARYSLHESRILSELPSWAVPGRCVGAAAAGTVLPIEWEQERPHVWVTINEKRAKLVLDTGSPTTVLEHSVALETGLISTGEAPHIGRWPFIGDLDTTPALADSFQLGQVTLHGVRVQVDDHAFWSGHQGVIGVDILSRFIVEFDASSNRLALVSRDRFEPPAASEQLAFPARRQGAVVDVSIPGSETTRALLDTGARHSYVKFSSHHGAPPALDSAPATGQQSLRTFEHLQIGSFRLPNWRVPTFEEGGVYGEAGEGILGMDTLRFFYLAFDFHNGQLYLEPNLAYHALIRSGLAVEHDEDGEFVVQVVVEPSAASRAGIEPGATVLALDGSPEFSLRGLRNALANHPSVRLGVVDLHGNRVDLALTGRGPTRGPATGAPKNIPDT